MKMRLRELRGLIREELERGGFGGLLREAEADLSGKSLSLVGRLEDLNRELEAHGIEAGIKQETNSRGETRFMFAVRSTTDPDKMELLPVGQLPKTATEKFRVSRDVLEKTPYGSIEVGPPGRSEGKCSGAFVVKYTSTTAKGWGPLLYDLAMEFATQQGGGLASDRGTVSKSARDVWNKYDSERSDVVPVQLDRLDGPRSSQLTPDDESDDCSQEMVLHLIGDLPQDDEKVWSKSPLSRAYLKTGGAVRLALYSAGLLWR